MKEIEQLYFNDFGVAFHWKKNNEVLTHKVQIIFKETGFYFTKVQIAEFASIISATCGENSCSGCAYRGQCHKFLLKTPIDLIDLAVSYKELMQIKDLVEGTLFHLDLSDYLSGMCKN